VTDTVKGTIHQITEKREYNVGCVSFQLFFLICQKTFRISEKFSLC